MRIAKQLKHAKALKAITRLSTFLTALIFVLITVKTAIAFDITTSMDAPSTVFVNTAFQAEVTVTYALNATDNASTLTNQTLKLYFYVDGSQQGFEEFTINPNESVTKTFTVVLNTTGLHELKANTTIIANESNVTNNVVVKTITAQQKTANMEVTVNNLGSEDQERGVYTTSTAVIKNTGNVDLTNIALSITADSKYELTASPETIAIIHPGESVNITITCYVPEDQDSGLEQIGVLTVTADSSQGQVSRTKNLYLQTISHLEIRDMDISFNDHSEDVDPEETVDDIPPGVDVSLEVEVKNTFDEDVKIKDITVSIENSDLDVDEESDEFDLADGRKHRVTLNFEIPLDTDEDEYDLEIRVEGEDENDAKHVVETFITLSVERESHEIKILRVSPAREEAYPGETFNVDVRIANTGRHDEDAVRVLITNTELNIAEHKINIVLDRDEETVVTIPITIPEDATPGSYAFIVRTYYDNDELSDVASFDFNVLEKPVEEQQPEQEQQPQQQEEQNATTIEIVQPEVQPQAQPITSTGMTFYGVETKFYEDPNFWLGVIIAIVVVIIITMLVLLFNMTKR